LAKFDEVEHFLAPETDEEDVGKEVLTGGQLMADDWLARGRIEKRHRWSHTTQQHSAAGEKGVVGVVHRYVHVEEGKGVRGVRHRQGADAAEAVVVQRTSCEAGENRGSPASWAGLGRLLCAGPT
jgi:hypothetical protein